jgi:hypothetical protein
MYYKPETGLILNSGMMVLLYGAILTPEQAKELGYLPFIPVDCEPGAFHAKQIVFTGSSYTEVLVATEQTVEATARAEEAVERITTLEAQLADLTAQLLAANLIAPLITESAPVDPAPVEPEAPTEPEPSAPVASEPQAVEPEWSAMTKAEIATYCQDTFGETLDTSKLKDELIARAHELWLIANS